MTALDLSCAPFRVFPDADPARVAADMAACFSRVAALPRKCGQTFDAAAHAAGLDAADALARAGRRIATDIDGGTGDGRANPYHNSQHFCEVVLCALCLSWLAGLTPGERARLLVAALAHDFHHDGRDARTAPFRLERLAVERTLPYLVEAGVAAEDREIIAAGILATEVSKGAPYARLCHRQFHGGGERPRVPAGIDGLAPLAVDARAALLAVLLTEADVLPSVGLTIEHGELSQVKLSREWGRPLGAADKLYFLEHVFKDFAVSHFFAPNLHAMKAAMAECIAAENEKKYLQSNS